MSAVARFWNSVSKGYACWVWTGDLTPKGYGRFYVKEKQYRAHRFIYEAEVGPIPEGMVVDHRCHNPACVRPSHLRAVTQKQNAENRAGSQVNSRSGIRGVTWRAGRNKWRASCAHNGKDYHGGHFDTVEEAAEAVKQLRNRLHTHNDLDRKTA